VKGLAELTAENDALVKRAEAKRKASLRRLKQRIANAGFMVADPTERVVRVADVNAAIADWDAAERKRGAR
jgi:hypothetical protein